MKIIFFTLIPLCLLSCNQQNQKNALSLLESRPRFIPVQSYAQLKDSLALNRKKLSLLYKSFSSLDTPKNIREISDYWVTTISQDLYIKWKNTPWDFNGTTAEPNEGTIACGYFVTTILRDMDLKINRHKLAICPSSTMMSSLTPNQKIKNLSYLTFAEFEDSLSALGKGVYIIGLDYHTGFIINDGLDNWFIHSNYINRQGVIKELASNSSALYSSKTRWIVSLTNDKFFLYRWLRGLQK